jgi:exoribonuclease R
MLTVALTLPLTETLSLQKNQTSFALSCGVVLNEDGSVKDFEIVPSLVAVNAKLTFWQVLHFIPFA